MSVEDSVFVFYLFARDCRGGAAVRERPCLQTRVRRNEGYRNPEKPVDSCFARNKKNALCPAEGKVPLKKSKTCRYYIDEF